MTSHVPDKIYMKTHFPAKIEIGFYLKLFLIRWGDTNVSLNLSACLFACVVYSLRGEDPESSVATDATLASCPVNLSNEIPRPQWGDFWKNIYFKGLKGGKSSSSSSAVQHPREPPK